MSGFLGFIGGLAVLAIICLVLLFVYGISVSNSFNRKSVKIDEALSGIEVALTKRYDTLTKMVDAAKGYTNHELNTLLSVISMRKGMTVPELTTEAEKMADVTSRLNVLAEAYPELHSNTVFEELQKGIRDTEEQLQAARRLYNANVSSYNQQLVVFPSSIIARAKGLTQKDFFEAEEHKRQDVKIQF